MIERESSFVSSAIGVGSLVCLSEMRRYLQEYKAISLRNLKKNSWMS